MRTTLCTFALLTLVACKKDAGDTGVSTGSWEDAFDASNAGSLSGVWGSGPDDVFIVGGSEAAGEIHHFDGDGWSTMTPPSQSELLVWVYGFSATDVYAVGLGGTVLHYDGSSWTALDSGIDVQLWGVWGSSSTDLWIVGGDIDQGEPVILRYDGSAFTPYALDPVQNSRGAHSLFKVWGIGGKTFAVGQDGLMIEFDGSQWVEAGAGPEADRDFVSLWGTSADRMVAVGGRANARIATYDGSAWSTFAPSGVGGLNAVFMDDPDTAMIGGVAGYLATFDVDGQTLERETGTTTLDVHAMWGDGAGRTYAVAGTFLDGNHQGAAMVRTAP